MTKHVAYAFVILATFIASLVLPAGLAKANTVSTFSGVLRDRSGTPASGQYVQLIGPTTEQHVLTPASGAFSLAVLPGTYQLRVLRSDPGGTAALPTRYEFSVMSFDLSADRVQDLTVQNVFLDVTVVNAAGAPVPNAVVDVPFAATTFELFPGGIASGAAGADAIHTNSAGVARLILLPSNAVSGQVTAPAGSGLPSVSFDAGALLADKQITVRLASDSIAPDTTIVSGPEMGSITTSTTAIFAFGGIDDVSPPTALAFACSFDGGDFQACTSPKEYTNLGDGTHSFAVRATDQAGNIDPSPATRSWIVDTTPPTITCVATPSALWPPDHRVRAVHVELSASDDVGLSTIALRSVTSDQEDAGLSDDDRPIDIQQWTIGTDDRDGLLRSERFSTGRTYAITYEAHDVAGNVSVCSAPVTVPKDQSH